MPAFVPIAILLGVKAIAARYLWTRRWRTYDPAWLIELAQSQYPRETWLVTALARCTRVKLESEYYTRFKPARRPEPIDASPPARNNIVLEDPVEGSVVLDVRPDGQIAGLEFRTRRLRHGD